MRLVPLYLMGSVGVLAVSFHCLMAGAADILNADESTSAYVHTSLEVAAMQNGSAYVNEPGSIAHAASFSSIEQNAALSFVPWESSETCRMTSYTKSAYHPQLDSLILHVIDQHLENASVKAIPSIMEMEEEFPFSGVFATSEELSTGVDLTWQSTSYFDPAEYQASAPFTPAPLLASCFAASDENTLPTTVAEVSALSADAQIQEGSNPHAASGSNAKTVQGDLFSSEYPTMPLSKMSLTPRDLVPSHDNLLGEESVQQFASIEPQVISSEVTCRKQKEYIIGYSAMQFSNPWYKDVVRGIEDACNRRNIKCVAVDANNDINKQLSDVRNMIDAEYDAIFVTPISPNDLAPLFREAQSKGIVTGSLAQIVPHSNLEYGMLEYDYGHSIGTQAAQWAKRILKCQGSALILSQDNIEATISRGDGIVDAMYNICPELKVISRAMSSNPEQGKAVVLRVLKQHPDLNMVVSATDAAGIGAYHAMVEKQAIGPERAIFSGDATLETLEIMKDENNIYRGTVKLSGIRAGYESIRMLYNMILDENKDQTRREYLPFVSLSKDEFLSTLEVFD